MQTTTEPAHWVFDYDGVIGDTMDSIARYQMGMMATDYAGAVAEMKRYSSQPRHCRRTWTPENHKIATRWNREFVEFLGGEYPPVFGELVHILNTQQQLKQAIVSNNSEASIWPVLRNIEHNFEFVLGLEHHHSKEERIAWVAREWGVEVSEIKFLTDTLADVTEVSHSLPKENIYACTWGCGDYEDFTGHLPPSQILTAPTQFERLV